MDALIAIIEHYVEADTAAGFSGCGCFSDPLGEVKECFEDNQIDEYVEYT